MATTANDASTATPEPILRLATGFMAAKHLFAASHVGIFHALGDTTCTLEELADRTSVPARTCRILVDAMVACGLVRRTADQYENEPAAQSFLAGRGPADLTPFLAFWDRISYPAWTALEGCVRSDQGAPLHLDAVQQDIFSRGVEAFTAGTAAALAETYEFGRHTRVLDLGGGTGSFLLAVLSRQSHLRATLFETADVVAVARARLAGEAARSRIDVVTGDFFVDHLPAGHDATLLANVLHLFKAEQNVGLLERARTAALVGTRLLLVDFWTDPTHTQPPLAPLMAGEFLVVAGGDVYSEEEVRRWLAGAGWRFLETRPLVGGASLIVAEAA